MKLKLLTFNLFFGKAIKDAERLLEQEQPDIVCVQELPTDLKNLHFLDKKPYKLAGWTNSFIKFWKIYGNATYINTKTCKLISDRDDALPASTYDLWVYLTQGMHMSRRFIESKILLRETGQEIAVYNAHLTHLSLIELRLSQLQKVFDCIKGTLPPQMPILIAGDFNLYNGKTELEELLQRYEIQEATTNLAYTFQHPIWFSKLKMKLDYILFRNMKVSATRRLDLMSSDHHPILSEFSV